MRSIGLRDTEMYGGYTIGTSLDPFRASLGRIPLPVEEQPYWGRGKRTTAYDLAGLARAVWLAGGGQGALRRRSRVHSRGGALSDLPARRRCATAQDRQVHRARPGVEVLHKAGWIDSARHDGGLVFWRGGVFVAP